MCVYVYVVGQLVNVECTEWQSLCVSDCVNCGNKNYSHRWWDGFKIIYPLNVAVTAYHWSCLSMWSGWMDANTWCCCCCDDDGCFWSLYRSLAFNQSSDYVKCINVTAHSKPIHYAPHQTWAIVSFYFIIAFIKLSNYVSIQPAHQHATTRNIRIHMQTDSILNAPH